MKKIAIIGTVGIPASYGGFETPAHFRLSIEAKTIPSSASSKEINANQFRFNNGITPIK